MRVSLVLLLAVAAAAIVFITLRVVPTNPAPSRLVEEEKGQASAPEAFAASDEVRIAGEAWPIAFESPTPAEGLRRLIAQDLHSTLGPFEHATIEVRRTASRVEVDGETVVVKEFLHLGGNDNYLVSAPDLATDFGDIVSVRGVRHLLVTHNLAQKYADSWGFAPTGARALERLGAFLAKVNSLVPAEMTDSEVAELFHPYTASRLSREALRRNAEGLSLLAIQRPSLLACEPTDLGPVACRAIALLKATGQRHSEVWLAYDAERWSLFLVL